MNNINRLNEASTSYNDLKGTMSIDFEGDPDNFEKFIRDLNVIDFEKYFPVGIEVFGFKEDICLSSIICIDRKDAPIENKTDIPVTIVNINIPFKMLLGKIKNLKIVLHSQFKSANDYIIENTIEGSQLIK